MRISGAALLTAAFLTYGLSSQALSAESNISGATKVNLWSTFYYALEIDEYNGQDSLPIRDMRDRIIGPRIKASDWCKGAIEGTIRISSAVYNYAGVRNPKQTDCTHEPSSRVRWTKAKNPYGDGSKGNPLIPFKTLACDLGTVKNSTKWLEGGYAKFGQKVYIPAARGVALPNGETHDGLFECGDIGGKITGNHIDVFLGGVRGGYANAAKLNPFGFIKSDPAKTIEAYVLP